MQNKSNKIIHKTSALLLAIMMLLTNMAPAIAYAMEEDVKYSSDDFYEYELTPKGYEVLGLTDKGKEKLSEDDFELTIPQSHNDIPIIGIAKKAFLDEYIKILNLPTSLEYVDDYAFYKNKKEDGPIETVRSYPDDYTLVLEKTGKGSFGNNDIKDFPFVVKHIYEDSFINNDMTYADLSYTEIIENGSFLGNPNLEPIVNKYSDVADKAFSEDTEITYVGNDFLNKRETNDNIDYVSMRQQMLDTMLAKQKNNEEDEESSNEDDDEDSDKQKEETNKSNQEESNSKNSDESESIEKQTEEDNINNSKAETTTLEKNNKEDRIAKESNADKTVLNTPKELTLKEFNLLKKHKVVPKRLSLLNLFNTAYAEEENNQIGIESVSSSWILGEEEGERYYEDGKHTYTWHKEENRFSRVKTDVILTGKKDYEVGTVQIRVPKHIFKDRNGNYIGRPTLGVSELPSERDTLAYLDAGDEFILINVKPISPATEISFEMTYRDLKPSQIKDKVTGYETDPFVAEVEVINSLGDKVTQSGNTLIADVDTRSYVDQAVKKTGEVFDGQYPNGWPKSIIPKDYDKYIFVEWKAYAMNQGSQPFKLGIEEIASDSEYTDNVKILGIRRNADMKMFAGGDKEVKIDKIFPIENKKEYGYIDPDANFDLTIYTAYPKEDLVDESGKTYQSYYSLKNKINFIMTSEDDKEITSSSAEATKTYKSNSFSILEPYSDVKKSGSLLNRTIEDDKNVGHYNVALNRLYNNKAYEVEYNINGTILGDKFTKPEDLKPYGLGAYGRLSYHTTILDDTVTLKDVTLSKGDYEFTKLNIPYPTLLQRSVKDSKWIGYNFDKNGNFKSAQDIYGGEWGYEYANYNSNMNAVIYDQDNREMAKVSFNKINKSIIPNKENGASLSGESELIFPKGTTSYRVEFKTNKSGFIYRLSPTVRILPSERVSKIVSEQMEKGERKTLELKNKAKVSVKEDKNLTKEDVGKNYLHGEFYNKISSKGHFGISKYGDGYHVPISDNKTINLYNLDLEDYYTGIYPHWLNKLQRGDDVELYYDVQTRGYGMPWTYSEDINKSIKASNPDKDQDFVDEAFNQIPYKIISRDDELNLKKDNKFIRLKNNDYEFSKIKVTDLSIYDYKKADKEMFATIESNGTRFNGTPIADHVSVGDYAYLKNNDLSKAPLLNVYAQIGDASNYIKVAEISYDKNNNQVVNITHEDAKLENGFVVFPKNTIAYKIEAETKLDAVFWDHKAYVRLKPSSDIKKIVDDLFSENKNPAINLYNKASLDLVLNDKNQNDVISDSGIDQLRGISYEEPSNKDRFTIRKEGHGDKTEFVDSAVDNPKLYGEYPMFLNKITNEDPDATISYKVTNKGFGMPYTYDKDLDIIEDSSYNKVPYTMISEDHTVDMGGEKLTANEFNFTSIKFEKPTIYNYEILAKDTKAYYEYTISPTTDWSYYNRTGGVILDNLNNKYSSPIPAGRYAYVKTNDYSKLENFKILAASDNGDYKEYGEISFNTGNIKIIPNKDLGANVSSDGSEIIFPKEDNITKYKVVLKTTMSGVEWVHYPSIHFKNSEKMEKIIDKLYNESPVAEVDVNNEVKMTVLTGKDEKVTSTSTDKGFNRLDGIMTGAKTNKTLEYQNNVESKRVDLKYYLATTIQTNITSKKDLEYAISTGGYKPEKIATFYDLLPEEVKVDEKSIETEPGAQVLYSKIIENYKNSGRDLLVVQVKREPDYRIEKDLKSIIGQEGYKDTPYIRFDATYSWRSVEDLGRNITNHSVYRSLNPNLGNIKGYKGENNDPSSGNNISTKLAFEKSNGTVDEKSKDLLKNIPDDIIPNMESKSYKDISGSSKVSDDKSFLYASSNNYLVIDTSSIASLEKTVDAEGNGNFTTGREETDQQNVFERQRYTYRKSIKAASDSKVKDLIFYDNIENYNLRTRDRDYGDERWKGTFLGVNTSQLKNKGANPVLYYSTTKNLVLDNNKDKSYNDLSNKSIWTKWSDRPKDLNNRDVTAIALDVRKTKDGKDFIIDEGDSVSYFINMLAPDLSIEGKTSSTAYANTTEEKEKYYDVIREPVDREYKKSKILVGKDKNGNPIYETLVFEELIYESEEGYTGGAHAYNNASAILTTVSATTGVSSENQLIRHDYTKVGLKPFVLNLKKTFDDDNDRDGLRPDTVIIDIFANGKLYKTVKLLDSENYSKELVVPYGDEKGNRIDYTYKEREDENKNYQFSLVKDKITDTGRSVEFNNKYTPEKVDISVNKTWSNIENLSQDKIPNRIYLRLLDKDTNKAMKTVIVSPDQNGNWTYDFKDLYKYKDQGKLINYSVREISMEDYRTTSIGDDSEYINNNKTININNEYYPYGDLKISKKVENASRKAIDNDFSFVLNINSNDDRLVKDYKAYKYNKETKEQIGEEFLVTNGSLIKIKHNEEVVIKDIDTLFTYSVEERAANGFNVVGRKKLTGTIHSYENSAANFINRYESKGTAPIRLSKELDGRDLRGLDFRFNIYETTNGKRELINKAPIYNDGNGNIKYDINYTSDDLGTSDKGLLNGKSQKTYEVVEIDNSKNDGISGFFIDDKKIFITVNLEDDGKGNINTSVSYNKEGILNEDDSSFTFNNRYRAELPYEPRAYKHIRAGVPVKENEFEFTLTQVGVYEDSNLKTPYKESELEKTNISTANNGKEVARAYANKDGLVSFDEYNGKPFIFNQYDAGKTFVFDLKEIDKSESDTNIIYDKSTIRKIISVKDLGASKATDNKGTLQIEESTEYLIDEENLEKAKEEAIDIVEKYNLGFRDDINKSEEILAIENAENIEDVKEVLNNIQGTYSLFKNEYKPGEIKVKKQVPNGDPKDPNREFKFKLTLTGDDLKMSASKKFKIEKTLEPETESNEESSRLNEIGLFNLFETSYAAEERKPLIDGRRESKSKLSDGKTPVWRVDENASNENALVIEFTNEEEIITLTFDPGEGGEGSMADMVYKGQIPDNKFTNPGMVFTGFKFFDKDGNEISRDDLDTLTGANRIKAVAQWEESAVLAEDGVLYFTLKANEVATFKGIPAFADYTIEELTDEQWYNENPKFKDMSDEEKQELIKSNDGWSLTDIKGESVGEVPTNDVANIEFINNFKAGEASAVIRGRKTLNNKTKNVSGYEFELYNTDQNGNLVASPIQTVRSNGNGAFEFEKLNFNSNDLLENEDRKIITYVVKEKEGKNPDIVYNKNEFKVDVILTKTVKDGEILLSANVDYPNNNGLVIDNQTKKTRLVVNKTFKEGTDFNSYKDRTFKAKVTLSDRDRPQILTLNKDNNFTAHIDNLEIGTKYEVSEIDIPNGFTEVNPKIHTGETGRETSEIIITNEYTPKGSVNLELNKTLIGRPLNQGEFEFEVLDDSGKPIKDDDGNNLIYSNGPVESNNTSKILINIPVTNVGVQNFKIRELDSNDETIVNDSKEITATVNVKDNGNGILVADSISYKDTDNITGNDNTFTNKLAPSNLQITKTVENMVNTDQRFTAKVELIGEDGNELTESFKYVSNKNSNELDIKSGDEISIGHKETITIKDLPVNTEYKVTETNIPKNFERVSDEVSTGLIKDKETSNVDIINRFNSKGTFYIKAKKNYNKELLGGDFTFALFELRPDRAKNEGFRKEDIKYFTNTSNGDIEIGPIEFTREDLLTSNGTLALTKKYRLVEMKDLLDEDGNIIKNRNPDIDYDASSYEITLNLFEEEGEIKVRKMTITKNGKEVEDITFNNKYVEDNTSIKIGKTVENEKEDLTTKPSFGVRVKLTYPNQTTKTIRLDLEDNEEQLINQLPIGTQYEIEEIDIDDEYRFKAMKQTEVDDSNLETVFKNTENSEEITNPVLKGVVNENQVQINIINERKPKRATITAEKLLNNKVTDEEFAFTLTREGESEPIRTANNIRKLIEFEELIYEDGFDGPKTYYINEVSYYSNNIIFDDTEFKAVVSEKEDSDELEVKYYKPDKNGKYEEVETVVFKNITTSLPNTGSTKVILAIIGLVLIVSGIGYQVSRKRK